MKKLIVVVSFFSFSTSSALALTVADVGGFDAYLDYTDSQLNENQDLDWILDFFPENNIQSPAYYKTEAVDDWVVTTDDASAIYYDFSGYSYEPFAFIIKSAGNSGFTFDDGKNGPVLANAVLFENLSSLQFGLVDMDWFTKTIGQFSVEAISHTSFATVPEPSTFLLLGGGYAGLVIVARRRKNSQSWFEILKMENKQINIQNYGHQVSILGGHILCLMKTI